MDHNKSLCSLFGTNYVVTEDTTWDAIQSISSEREGCFYHLSIDELVRRVKQWKLKLPRVHPHYAVKCNDDPAVLRTLALLGAGFDCASRAEMKKVLSLGVSPARIIFAHPCKIGSHITYAKVQGIKYMTFDSSQELVKVSKMFPEAALVIRIRCDAASAQCELGIKFGVMPHEVRPLLALAASLHLGVVGVAFHVGSGCAEPEVFLRAIKAARQVFLEAEAEGHTPYLLDIGGGFLGGKQDTLDQSAHCINTALEAHFPESLGVRIIAEPGRYMVASAFTLATRIINRREVLATDADESVMYFIDDGLYGSFNCVLYDHQVVKPTPLQPSSSPEERQSSVWGPTCDGFDQVISSMLLPRSLAVGDWLVWEDMGAYTLAAAGNFNGFPLPGVVPHLHTHTRLYLEELLQVNALSDHASSGVCSDEDYISSAGGSRSISPLSNYSDEDHQRRAAAVESLLKDNNMITFCGDLKLKPTREV